MAGDNGFPNINEVLFVGFDHQGSDTPVLSVIKHDGSRFNVLQLIHGTEATEIYNKLITLKGEE